jgi:hypothetical protein
VLVGYLVFLITASSGFGLSQNKRTGGSIYLKTLKGPVDFMEEPVKKGWS